jgi:hypothetical protein
MIRLLLTGREFYFVISAVLYEAALHDWLHDWLHCAIDLLHSVVWYGLVEGFCIRVGVTLGVCLCLIRLLFCLC